jgi:hypothetical protein
MKAHLVNGDLIPQMPRSPGRTGSQASEDSAISSVGSSLLAPSSRSTSASSGVSDKASRRLSGGPRSPLLTPSGLLERLPASWTSSSKRNSGSLLTWEADGYATLPDDPRLVLEDLGESVTAGMSAPEPPSLLPDTGFPATRDIPKDAPYTLAFEGVLPDAITFELHQLAPALIQAGEYGQSIGIPLPMETKRY